MLIPLQFLRTWRRHSWARRHWTGTLKRYLYWQLHSRLTGRPLAFRGINDTRLIASPGWPVTSGTYYFKVLEFESTLFLVHLLRRGDLFVDVGAHVGTYALCAASTGAAVIAVEPDLAARAKLQEHVALNQMERKITVVPKAVSSTPAHVLMTNTLGQQNYIVDTSGRHTVTVQADTLDQICNGRSPAALKIDVEGHEYQVLSGADRILRNPILKAVCIETMGLGERFGDSDTRVMDCLRQHGFEPVDYDPVSRLLQPARSDKSMQIAIRNIEEIGEILAAAKPVQIGKHRI